MCPPSQALNGQITGENEDEESGDFDQVVRQEILKCRLNTLRKQQVCHSLLLSCIARVSRRIGSFRP